LFFAVVAAVAAAGLFALGSAFQHFSAGKVQGAGRGRSTGLAGFVSNTLWQPLWAVGLLANAVGLVFHAVALRNGPLTLVQPLLVTSVVFALPLRHMLEHRSPHRGEVAWAVALCSGLVAFIVLASPAQGAAQAPDTVPTLVFAAVLACAIVGCTIGGWYTSGASAAVLMAAAAALAFAACAGLLKEVMDLWPRGPGAVLGSWPVYALAATGAVGVVLSQLAYQAGPLSASLPIVTTLDPMVSILIGTAVFDEPFRAGAVFVAGEVTGLLLVVVAAVFLSRSPGQEVQIAKSSHVASPGKVRAA
jgi:drug/metabolite transporter (DMT)-like permease